MKKVLLMSALTLSTSAYSLSLPIEQSEHLDSCNDLFEQISKSDCGQKTLGFLQDAYLKLGGNLTQRRMMFEDAKTSDKVFEMAGDWNPTPILTLSLGDSYFENSNFGYQLGVSYFSDAAYEQKITRGSEDRSVDLTTYSIMSVISFTPTIFYSFGRGDDTPKSFFTAGVGLNLGYSSVKGSAFITEFESDSVCYDTGTAFVNGTATSSDITANCELGVYDSSTFSTGAQIYLAYESNLWLTELSSSIFTQEPDEGYTFSTGEVSVGISRKFTF
jgi:hypothetical protein